MNSISRVRVSRRTIPSSAEGWWREQNDEVLMRYHFQYHSKQREMEVRVFSHDGEELEVHNLTISEGWIAFSTYCISTDYSAAHRWRFNKTGNALHEYTLTDTWVKAKNHEVNRAIRKKYTAALAPPRKRGQAT